MCNVKLTGMNLKCISLKSLYLLILVVHSCNSSTGQKIKDNEFWASLVYLIRASPQNTEIIVLYRFKKQLIFGNLFSIKNITIGCLK